MRHDELDGIGERLARIRGPRSQAEFAQEAGIHKNTLGTYERAEREIGALPLIRLVRLGWNANWLLTGEGPETRAAAGVDTDSRTAGSVVAGVSHTMNLDVLRMAIGLADQLLGRTTPPDYAEIVSLIHDLVLEGLPEAQIVSIAGRQASSRRVAGGTGSSQGSAAAPASAAEGSRKTGS